MEENKSGFICGESSNFYDKIDWTIRVPPEIVESSVSVDAFVSGDILGPTLKVIVFYYYYYMHYFLQQDN